MAQIVSNPMLASGSLIEGLLSGLLRTVPDASLACLFLIDPLDRHVVVRRPLFAVANTIGRIRRPGDMLRHMRSLLDWDLVLPLLREGQCQFVRVVSRRDAPVRKRRGAPDAFSVLICPASYGDLVGLVLLAWDVDDPPDRVKPIQLMRAGTLVGSQIAAVMELRAQIAAFAPGRAAA